VSGYDDGDWPAPTSGPTARMEGWSRADAAWLKRYPDSVRVADVVCDRKGPVSLFAAVLAGGRVATTDQTLEQLGGDFLADCRCGWTHAVVGDKLASAVSELPSRRGRKPPRVPVRVIERPGGALS
jgi:hypothetical protein